MKNQKTQFAALVSEAGNWDVVVDDIYSEEYDQKIKGRIELGWYDSEKEAQGAIDEYRNEELESLKKNRS